LVKTSKSLIYFYRNWMKQKNNLISDTKWHSLWDERSTHGALLPEEWIWTTTTTYGALLPEEYIWRCRWMDGWDRGSLISCFVLLILNYMLFDLVNFKFDNLSYSKKVCKQNIFFLLWPILIIKILKHDLNFTMFAHFFE
jgi:hypothetical protein